MAAAGSQDPDLAVVREPMGTLWIKVQQGYLAVSDTMNLRVRRMCESRVLSTGGSTFSQRAAWSEERWFLTFKQKVPGRTIEIQQALDGRDGMELWEISTRRVKKIRRCFENWELDLLYDDSDNLYFALLEREVEEGKSRPEVPEFLQKYVLYEVDLTDDRFSNKNLGDVTFASGLYAQIQGEH